MTMGKRILIIGNGFDMAHGLPTSYKDFLEFAERYIRIFTFADRCDALQTYKRENLNDWNGNNFIKEELDRLFVSRIINKSDDSSISIPDDEKYNRLYKYLKDNIWYHFFDDKYKSKQIRGLI